MVSLSSAREASAGENDLVGRDAIHGERIAESQLVLGESASLVRAENVHAGQFFDGYQPADNRLFLSQKTGADCHGH